MAKKFTRRDFEVIYAAMYWNADVEIIGCENEEFDKVMDAVREAAGIEDREEWLERYAGKEDLCECGREKHLCATWDGSENHGDRGCNARIRF